MLEPVLEPVLESVNILLSVGSCDVEPKTVLDWVPEELAYTGALISFMLRLIMLFSP